MRAYLAAEPTSGLDSSASLRIVQMLARLSKQGRSVISYGRWWCLLWSGDTMIHRVANSLVILTVHQPRPQVVSLFSKVLVRTALRPIRRDKQCC
jgi:energy-coupling factor transporter ATP-binding protein EcfA2